MFGTLLLAALVAGVSPAQSRLLEPPAKRLTLAECQLPVGPPSRPGDTRESEQARCGIFRVPENRDGANARMLPLKVIVLPARAGRPREPIFSLTGGPGQAATAAAPFFARGWQRERHDVVFMDLRGTGEGHRLNCSLGGNDSDPQSYLEPLFREGRGYAACRDALAQSADLAQYTTVNSMRDLDELREALGYAKINLDGVSYGTRAALTYIRMFGKRVHAAYMNSAAALENRAPLFHASAAQRGFDELVKQCEAEAACKLAYPHLQADLRSILQSLRTSPAKVAVPHPATGAATQLDLTASAFGDALRVMLYSAESGRRVPLLLQQAKAGNFRPFAEAALQSSRRVKLSVATGLLLSTTCSEDVWRIRPEEVGPATHGSFIGSQRVLGQMEACSIWPRGRVPRSYYAPFRSNVPVLIVSGHLDPATPPVWGDKTASYFTNSLHAVFPGAHSANSPCIDSLVRQLFESGSAKGIDARCIRDERNPPFVLPASATS